MRNLKKAFVIGVVTLLVLSIGALFLLTSLIRVAGAANHPEVIFYYKCDKKVVALTIDDGPDVSSTSAILDLLQENDSSATFFLVGERMTDSNLLTQIADSKSELGNHGYTEQPLIYMPEASARESIEKTHNLISQYQHVKWFRPPSAVYNANVLDEVERYGYTLVIGDVYPYDHIHQAPWFSRWYIQTFVKNGSIIILHESNGRGETTLTVLKQLIPSLIEEGYQVMSLTELSRQNGCRKPQ